MTSWNKRGLPWEKLAHYVGFRFEVVKDASVNRHATSRSIYDPVPATGDCCLNGRHGTIFCNDKFYQSLCEAHDKCEGRFTELEVSQLQDYLHLAGLLLHELAHIAWTLRPKIHREEAIMESCPIGELGFALEDMVWGGTRDRVGPDQDLYIQEWPAASIANSYKHNGMDCTINDELPRIERSWRVPHSWLVSLFQDDYWNQVVAKRGAEALKVPRLCATAWTGVLPCTCDELTLYTNEAIDQEVEVDEVHSAMLARGCVEVTEPDSPLPFCREEDPACKFKTSVLSPYVPSNDLKEGKGVELQDLVPEGCMMLWEGTIVASALKTKIEEMLGEAMTDLPDTALWEVPESGFWVGGPTKKVPFLLIPLSCEM